jgi:hypothetical protein
MFLTAPCIGLLLCFLVLFTNAWQPLAMPPMPVAYRSFWRTHGELITAALHGFFQHMRLRPFILYTLVDRGGLNELPVHHIPVLHVDCAVVQGCVHCGCVVPAVLAKLA